MNQWAAVVTKKSLLDKSQKKGAVYVNTLYFFIYINCGTKTVRYTAVTFKKITIIICKYLAFLFAKIIILLSYDIQSGLRPS